MKGHILSIKESEFYPLQYCGKIIDNDSGKQYYFSHKDNNPWSFEDFKIGNEVEFQLRRGEGKIWAEIIKVVSEIESFVQYKEDLLSMMQKIDYFKDFRDFEDTVCLLLKLLGIHDIFKYPRENQAGKADGFFTVDNLAVIYDCTLQMNFEEFKKDQIENYINQLQESKIVFNIKGIDDSVEKKVRKIQDKEKQVWIITKGKSRQLKDVDTIKVKEVSIYDLLKILEKRIENNYYDIKSLFADLLIIDKALN